MSFARPRALLFGGTLLVTVSCKLLLGIEDPVGEARPQVAIEGGSDPCAHTDPPSRPETDDDPSTTSQHDYWLAADRIIIPMKPDAGIQPGVDLDQSCTCKPDLHDGAAPCATPAEPRVRCDFEGGVDDSLGAMAREYGAFLPFFDLAEPANVQIRNGARTLLVYLANYNGKANDKDVGIAFVGSGGLYTNLGCDGVARDAGPPQAAPDSGKPGVQRAPVWDGCDRWSPIPGAVKGRYPSRVASITEAYVSNYTLVVHVKEVALQLFGGSVRLGNGVAVARLIPENGSFRADGFIAGRMQFTELTSVLGRIADADGGPALCDTPAWAVAAPSLCAARDTMQSPTLDHMGQVCDAITGTVGFTARAAQVDDVEYENPTRGKACLNGTELACTPGK
jgi:hypothetical protein